MNTPKGTLRIDSTRRIAAMAVVIGCHLGLLLLLLRPANYPPDTSLLDESAGLALRLRFIDRPPSASAQARPQARVPSAPHLRTDRKPPVARRAVPSPALATHEGPLESRAPLTTPSAVSTTSDPYAAIGASMNDGGFQDRLRSAQHAHDVHGVPGSDTRIVNGIQLVNPMNQGIGAVLRKTQRLFGVTNSHCIDVDAWRQLTPDELAARHISAKDIDKINEQYGCQRPLGLSF